MIRIVKQNFAIYNKYFILKQTYVDDMYYKRIIYREQHESQIAKLIDSGAQVIGGGLFPYSGAYYIINCNDEEPIKQFLKQDPYNKKNLSVSEYFEIQPLTSDNFDNLAFTYDFK